MESANYMQVVPDSHYWTDLNQIIANIDYYFDWMERQTQPKELNVYLGDFEMSKNYLLVGFLNCVKHGFKIKRFAEPELREIPRHFKSINQIIDYVQEHEFEIGFDYHEFQVYLKNTITSGFNLTNGLKMERKEIYNRIDGERDYQDASWGHRRTLDGTPDEEKPVAEWINYIEYHVSKAKERVYHLDTNGATHELRKVAALAVRAMEIHGCPERDKGKIWNPLMGTTPQEQANEDKPCCGGDCDCKK